MLNQTKVSAICEKKGQKAMQQLTITFKNIDEINWSYN